MAVRLRAALRRARPLQAHREVLRDRKVWEAVREAGPGPPGAHPRAPPLHRRLPLRPPHPPRPLAAGPTAEAAGLTAEAALRASRGRCGLEARGAGAGCMRALARAGVRSRPRAVLCCAVRGHGGTRVLLAACDVHMCRSRTLWRAAAASAHGPLRVAGFPAACCWLNG